MASQTLPELRTPAWRRVAVATMACGLVLVSTAFHVNAFDNAWLEWLRYLPYPTYLLMAVVALTLSMGMGPLWRMMSLVSLLFVVWLAMGCAIGQADSGSVPLRVMTYNIKAYLAFDKPGGYGRIAAEIAEHNPEVLLMQDAQQIIGAGHTVIPELNALLDGRHAYAEGELVIASRSVLRNCHSLPALEVAVQPTAITCRTTVDGLDIQLVAAHLLSPRRGLNATRQAWIEGFEVWAANYRQRRSQAELLAARISQPATRLILGGDLNAAEHSPVLRPLLASGLRDAFSTAGRGYGYTLGHALRPGISLLRLDHVLVSADVGVERCFVGSSLPSEHRPVIADLWLQRAP